MALQYQTGNYILLTEEGTDEDMRQIEADLPDALDKRKDKLSQLKLIVYGKLTQVGYEKWLPHVQHFWALFIGEEHPPDTDTCRFLFKALVPTSLASVQIHVDKLSGSSAKAFGKYLRETVSLTQLELSRVINNTFAFSTNNDNNSMTSYYSSGLIANQSLMHLEIDWVLQSKGAEMVSKLLATTSRLQSLSIHIDDAESWRTVNRGLMKNTTLQTIELQEADWSPNKDVKWQFSINSTLYHLSLGSLQLSDNAMQSLYEAVVSSKTLKRLTITYPEATVYGYHLIGEIVKLAVSLISIEVNGSTDWKERGYQFFCRGLLSNYSIQKIRSHLFAGIGSNYDAANPEAVDYFVQHAKLMAWSDFSMLLFLTSRYSASGTFQGVLSAQAPNISTKVEPDEDESYNHFLLQWASEKTRMVYLQCSELTDKDLASCPLPTRRTGAVLPIVESPMLVDRLVVARNKIATGDTLVARFPNLTFLDVSHNSLASLTPLLNLPFLTTLDISYNQLETLPTLMGWAESLVELNLNSNRLKLIDRVFDLKKLQRLFFMNNLVAEIPLAFVDEQFLGRLKELELGGNPLIPAQGKLLANSSKSLKEFVQGIQDLKNSPPKPWNQIKVVLCGREGVGKTHLCHRLRNLKYDQDKSTDGIVVSILAKSKGIRLRHIDYCFFDLGGQEVFSPTHQFFTTSSSIYLLVFDLRVPDDPRVEYWVRTLREFLRPRVPRIILVGTHLDKAGLDTSSQEILRDALSKKLHRISPLTAVHFVSSTAWFYNGIEELQTTLAKTSEEMELLNIQTPGFYQEVYSRILTRMSDSQQRVVSLDQFRKFFCPPEVDNDTTLTTMLSFFNDTGVVTWFDKIAALKDLVVLDSQFLADLFSSIVTFSKRWKHGKVNILNVQDAWRSIPSEQHKKWITLLEKYEILIPIKQGEEWFVPTMLQEENTQEFDKLVKVFQSPIQPPSVFKVQRVIKFDFLPRAFFPRLFALLIQSDKYEHHLSKKNGLILQSNYTSTTDPSPNHASGAAGNPMLAFDGVEQRDRLLLLFDDFTFTLTITALVILVKFNSGQDLFSDVLNATVAMIGQHFAAFSEKIHHSAACYHCLYNQEQPAKIGLIELDQISEAFQRGDRTLPCPLPSDAEPRPKVELRAIAPDVCLAHIQLKQEVELGEVLGEGAFGTVVKGKLGQAEVAVKTLSPQAQANEWRHEVFIMSKLNHPNVVKLNGIIVNPLRIVLEYCNGGDLHQFLSQSTPDILPFDTQLQLITDIARGVEYLHGLSPPILHRDLRSPNILISTDLSASGAARIVAKVSDFGLAHLGGSIAQLLHTWGWLGPEVFDATNPGVYSNKSDVYSFGIIIWSILHPQSWPFTDKSEFVHRTEVELTVAHMEASPDLLDTYLGRGYKIQPRTDGTMPDLKAGPPKTPIRLVFEEFDEIRIKRAISQKDLRPTISPAIETATDPRLKAVVALMKECWLGRPDLRPDFPTILKKLTSI